LNLDTAQELGKMTTLTQVDLEDFAKLSIPAELLKLAGVERVSDSEARCTYGIKGGGDMAGIAFPYFDPETMSNGRRRTYVRIRRDHPEIEYGRPKKKHIAPYGDRKRLYFPPTPELFADATVPIVLVEAEKSCLAMTAWAARSGRKILPIAMGGCYGWRGKTGIKETPTGERVPEMGAIRDLGIARAGRRTYILLDANCGSNPQVLAARGDLVRQLHKQGADVHTLDLPASEGVNGPDDYVGVMGDDAMTQLFEGAAEGVKILSDVRNFLRRFVVLSLAQSTAIALWIAHTYTFKSASWTPYLNVKSAAPECGKSLLLEVLEFVVRKPWKVDGATAAVLFRKIEVDQPTLLFDELDTTFKGDKETAQAIRQVLNAGAKYNGTIARVVGENHTPKDFRVFCPKVLAGIGNLPPTVSGRSLPITLGRKLPTEKVDYLDHDNSEINAKAADLRRRLADWIEKRAGSFKQSPDFPDTLTDRQKDGARILLAIADTAGGEWPSQARTVLCEIYGTRPPDDTSTGIQLLADVRLIYHDDQIEKMTTVDLLEKLSKVETSPWAEWNRGKPMTAVGLSRLLKPFEIYPKNIRTTTAVQKGYERYQFEDAWGRYLPKASPGPPSPTISPAIPLQANIHASETHFSETLQEESVAGSNSEESPVSIRVVAAVADQEEGETHLEGKDLTGQRRCYVHGIHADWWQRPNTDQVCNLCHPIPRECKVTGQSPGVTRHKRQGGYPHQA
jgi:hypothetical protein